VFERNTLLHIYQNIQNEKICEKQEKLGLKIFERVKGSK
jgi:hypothetical protein